MPEWHRGIGTIVGKRSVVPDAAARPSSSDSGRTGFFWSTCADRVIVEAVPLRPCDAAGLLDELPGSTRGPRDAGRWLWKALRGRKSEKRERLRTRAATALRPERLRGAVCAGVGDLLGNAGFSILGRMVDAPLSLCRAFRTAAARCGASLGREPAVGRQDLCRNGAVPFDAGGLFAAHVGYVDVRGRAAGARDGVCGHGVVGDGRPGAALLMGRWTVDRQFEVGVEGERPGGLGAAMKGLGGDALARGGDAAH